MKYNAFILIYAVEIILAIQTIIATGELLRYYRIYRKDGLMAWDLQRSGPKLAVYVRKLKLDFVCKYPNVLFVLILRLLSAIALIPIVWLHQSAVIPLLLITVINLLMQIRNSQSNDGSDQMATVCYIVLLFANVINTVTSMSCALFFIAAQAALAYGTSGFLKMQKIGWYNGEYVTDILKTSSYGNKKVLAITQKSRSVAKVLGIMVVYGDCLLSVSFLFPPHICMFILVFGVCLHVGIGRIMGLNTFLWSYIATYPATYYVSYILYFLILN
ncbi:hypothetical protein [Pedobacter jeongneungensis]|uniref:hypothetical protein n=1 Tax=Pedobacter jeongneungensis TaxID=947309 RepID=UPI0031D2624C